MGPLQRYTICTKCFTRFKTEEGILEKECLSKSLGEPLSKAENGDLDGLMRAQDYMILFPKREK